MVRSIEGLLLAVPVSPGLTGMIDWTEGNYPLQDSNL